MIAAIILSTICDLSLRRNTEASTVRTVDISSRILEETLNLVETGAVTIYQRARHGKHQSLTIGRKGV